MSKAIFRNGALLIVPPLFVSFSLWAFLPSAYSPEIFWKDIPAWLGLAENISRALIFIVPAVLVFGCENSVQRRGWFLYGFGLLIYLCTYLAQIFLPNSLWSNSLIGFTAPAWSPLLWLYGIGLLCLQSWLFLHWYKAIYFILSSLFVIFHTGHAALVYTRVVMG